MDVLDVPLDARGVPVRLLADRGAMRHDQDEQFLEARVRKKAAGFVGTVRFV